MNFSTKTKRKKASSWREDAGSAPSKKAKEGEEGEERPPKDADDEFARLKRELAERERTKAMRRAELEREENLISRTRGGVGDMERTAKDVGVLCYLDIEIGKKNRSEDQPASGRMICELFEDVVPRTVKNFAALVTGEKGDGLAFEGSTFHKVLPGVACTGGDIDRGDGTGGRSIYGRDFEDENYTLKHTDAGVLTMFAKRPNSNSSQFQILFAEQPALDGRQVVFGRVIDGFAILREIEKLGAPNGTPSELARIKASGMIEFSDGATLAQIIEKHQTDLVLPKKVEDPKTIAKNYRNKTNYYDNSTRSALFSWTTSA